MYGDTSHGRHMVQLKFQWSQVKILKSSFKRREYFEKRKHEPNFDISATQT